MKKNPSVRDVEDFLGKWAPPSLAEDWDNVGLQVGAAGDPVTGILVSLDVTEAALWEAVEKKANLLVTHHPLIFRPLSRIDESRLVPRLVRLACQTGINILSFHTNLDSTREGLNDQLAQKLGLRALRPLVPAKDPFQRKSGLGRIGLTSPVDLKTFLKKISQKLMLKNFRYVGDPKHRVKNVAVMTGSGGNYYPEAKAAGADVLVTGDVKYHAALEALAYGIAMVDIGHFSGEIGMVPLVAKKLRQGAKKKGWSLSVHETQEASDPFQTFSGK